jgi:hypothetical protein
VPPAPAPPPATTRTSTAVIPVGTLNVADPVAVKEVICGAFTSMLKERAAVPPLVEVAVMSNDDTVFEPTADAVPPMNPFAEVSDIPVGREPEVTEYVTDSPVAVAETV